MSASPFVRVDPTETLAATGKVVARALIQPSLVVRKARRALAGDASAADRRFTDPTWQTNVFFRRWLQAYSGFERELKSLPDEVEIEEHAADKARFALSLVADALAPTNLLFTNPAALRRARETRGRSLVAGGRNFVRDLRHNGAMPSMVKTEKFTIGERVACTAGAVVHRTDVLELIQYRPTTRTVRRCPLVIVPPQINKYYILDLAPGRSLIEHAVANGQQVFAISWRNPGPEHADWDLTRYVEEVERALAVARRLSRAPSVNVVGACAGGITAATTLARGKARVGCATFLVTALDSRSPSTLMRFGTDEAVARAIRRSRRRGVLGGDELARAFAWLRPNDLVWSYWVNNYLLGNEPPAFDVLAWNADSTNLPAGLHVDFLRIFAANALAHPNALELGDVPIDLRQVAVDSYVLGASTDHITPWQACYASSQLLGGKTQFVLSSSGHIQALVNPPGNPRARYFTNDDLPADPDGWLAGASEQSGTWWDHWLEWLGERSGDERRAPRALGSTAHPPLDPAPGTYVRG
jgi:polyhydroxyalkanoate synthase